MGARTSTYVQPDSTVAQPGQRVWSEQQQDIFAWFANGGMEGENPNLVVRARAGTGKTSTIVEAVTYAPEEAVLLTAFNKAIAEELNSRLPASAEAKTLHGIGMRYIGRRYRRIPIARGMDRGRWLVQQVAGKNLPSTVEWLVAAVCGKARELTPLDCDFRTIRGLMDEYGLEVDDRRGWTKFDNEFVAQKALKAYEFAAENPPDKTVGVDFADMIFLPLRHDLLSADYPMVVVDETQDMIMAQLQIVRAICAGRICIVGDDKQAIYGFRGADVGSLDRLKRELGAKELPLTVTYRCGRNIVTHAQRLVPDIEAHESNPAGAVTRIRVPDMLRDAKAGDFVLSRLNAPMVSLCLAWLASGKRARIKGRDIGEMILKVLKKVKVGQWDTIDAVREWLDQYRKEKVALYLAQSDLTKADALNDNCNVLLALMVESESMAELEERCAYLFTDDISIEDTIMLSTVHKAKGLESRTVFLLMDTLYRFKDSENDPEERNIEYVACTRAKEALYLVYEK